MLARSGGTLSVETYYDVQALGARDSVVKQKAERLRDLEPARQNRVSLALVPGIRSGDTRAVRLHRANLVALAEPTPQRLAVIPAWVRQQLDDLAGLQTGSPERTKAEFQRLGLRVTMMPTRHESARPFYQAEVVNSLPWLTCPS